MIRNKLKKALGFIEEDEINDNEVEMKKVTLNTHSNESSERNMRRASENIVNKTGKDIVVRSPKTLDDAQKIADFLIEEKAVFIDLNNVPQDKTRRILDFLTGVIYCMDGEIQQMGPRLFLFAPTNCSIDGAIESSDSGIAE